MDVLEGILGVSLSGLKGDTKKQDGHVDNLASVVENLAEDIDGKIPSLADADGIEFGKLSLEEFAQDTLPQPTGVQRLYSRSSTEEYGKEKEKFQDLHRSIKACDEVLKSVESYLSAFQTDLGTVSAEIESLQNRSLSLGRQLDNRRNVEKLLGPIIDDVVFPPNDIRRLVEGEVNESWVKALYQTDRRVSAINGKDSMKVKAVQEVQPELENITHKAIERVRDFFVSRIKALRLPGTNAQSIQQQGFVRYHKLFQFMANHHEQLAEEIGQAYVNTMRWYYCSHFQRYQKALEKVKLHTMDKNDILGQEESARKNTILPSLKTASVPSYDPFNIGRRIEVLRNWTAPIVTATQAQDDKSIHYPEFTFRHFNAALIENASVEYTFLTEFFSHKKYDEIATMFNRIFDQTFAIGKSVTKGLIDNAFDSLGVLLCVRLNQYALFEMQKRRIPAADNYLNATNMLLWPRFQIVMDAHCESLRKMIDNSKIMAAFSGAVSKQSAAPHFITQRFSSLLYGILTLSAESGDDEPVQNSLGRLKDDFEVLLTKLSAGISDAKKRERFLYNNYSLVLTIISDTDGKLAMDQKHHFEGLRRAYHT